MYQCLCLHAQVLRDNFFCKRPHKRDVLKNRRFILQVLIGRCPHQPRIGICPELSGRIAILFFCPNVPELLIGVCMSHRWFRLVVFCRFWHLVDSAIDDSIVAPLSAEWKSNTESLVQQDVLKLKNARNEFWKVRGLNSAFIHLHAGEILNDAGVMCWILLKMKILVTTDLHCAKQQTPSLNWRHLFGNNFLSSNSTQKENSSLGWELHLEKRLDGKRASRIFSEWKPTKIWREP